MIQMLCMYQLCSGTSFFIKQCRSQKDKVSALPHFCAVDSFFPNVSQLLIVPIIQHHLQLEYFCKLNQILSLTFILSFSFWAAHPIL